MQLLAELAVEEEEERALEVSLPGCVAFTVSCEWAWVVFTAGALFTLVRWLVVSSCLMRGESSMNASVFFRSSKATGERKRVKVGGKEDGVANGGFGTLTPFQTNRP